MFKYEQATGKLFNNAGQLFGVGYAGRDAGKNNPAMQNVKGIGPLPVGFYTILAPYNHPTVGKYAMPLIPDPTNEMFGRNSFFMHGDSEEHPGLASHGCIVQMRTIRGLVWASGDRRIEVVSGL